MKNITFFKFQGVIDILNDNGYVHFITKSICEENDFENGVGFFINKETKEYGKAFVKNCLVKEKVLKEI